MAQTDYVILDQAGVAFLQNLNSTLAAIVTNNSGPTEPQNTYPRMWWADTETGLLKNRNAGDSAWVTIGSLNLDNFGLLPLAGGTMTGTISDFMSTGIDDKATSTAITVAIDGSIGIGNPDPSTILDLRGKSYTDGIHIENPLQGSVYYASITFTRTGASGGAKIQTERHPAGGVGLSFHSTSNNADELAGNYTESMKIDRNGTVTIGGNPSDIDSQAVSISTGAITTSSNSTSARTSMAFRNPNGQAGSITVSGLSTAYNTSSDYRLKTDINPMTDATETFKKLKPVNFEWIVDGSRVDGFLAHELQEVIPGAATGTKDGMRDEEYELIPAVEAIYDHEGHTLTPEVQAVTGTRSVADMQGIDQSKIIPLMVATIQELITRIEKLESSL